ncbi:MAG TPA: hypothetical protein VLJ16_00830 [Acidobacteriota bacterium]|nr:hypothetical protein [Acidobacteriota bacterium]
MKKLAMVLLVLAVSAAAAAPPAWSQARKTDVSLNLGVQTNIWHGTSFDNAWFTVDLRVGVPLGKNLELAPELMYATDDSLEFAFHNLYPGVVLNYRSGGFFAGAGAVLPIGFGGGESDTASPSPKINLGYDLGKLKLSAYFLMFLDSGIDFLDVNQAGITLGYKF